MPMSLAVDPVERVARQSHAASVPVSDEKKCVRDIGVPTPTESQFVPQELSEDSFVFALTLGLLALSNQTWQRDFQPATVSLVIASNKHAGRDLPCGTQRDADSFSST